MPKIVNMYEFENGIFLRLQYRKSMSIERNFSHGFH